MSPLEAQLITRKAKLIEEDLSKLRDFEKVTLDEYTDSPEIRLQVERLLERIVGRVIDINYHVLKEEFGIMPKDYYRSFIELGKKGVIEEKFARQLAQSAGLRNALAHEYEALDDSLVHSSIKTCLTQTPNYLDLILEKYSS